MKQILFALALAAPAVAAAQAQAVSLTSTTFVAKEVTLPNGKKENKLFEPKTVLPGDPLVFMLDYKNTAKTPAAAFVINNPVPGAVSFTGVEQPWAVVSVDRGASFGALASLKVKAVDGTMRAALPSDVTHVRWNFPQPIPAGGAGRVMYFGIVK